MGLFWRNKKQHRNSSDNNITISSSSDIMFNIGKDLGEIKSSINIHQVKTIKKLNNHEQRITKIENHLKKEGR